MANEVTAGTTHGRWVFTGNRLAKGYTQYVEVRCNCGSGVTKYVQKYAWEKGHTKSCGCYAVEMTKQANTTHGMKGSKVYNIWLGMRKRCNLPTNKDYARYGGSGIKVCPEWESFEAFLADMGDVPGEGYSLDRIDGAGNYEKANCRWATQSQQARNKKNNVWVEIKGKTMVLRDWLAVTGHNEKTIAARVAKGMTYAEAFQIDSPAAKEVLKKLEAFLSGRQML